MKRWRPQLNEENYWVVVGRTESGWSSRFGELRGIDGVPQTTRLEVMPYVSASSRTSGNRDLANPFDDGLTLGGRVGADMKVGLGSNLTLEATINPDFGQIEADPAEVNLTVFETIFDERRPFFIEGNSVLEAGTSNFYYSRRIGATADRPGHGPVRRLSVDQYDPGRREADWPHRGRHIARRAGCGDRRRAREHVRRRGDLVRAGRAAERLWSVGRVIQELGRDSTVGAHLTLVHRDLAVRDPLAAVLNRNAISAGADTRVRFLNRTYEAAFSLGLDLHRRRAGGDRTGAAGERPLPAARRSA